MKNLGKALMFYRIVKSENVRDLAKEIGISSATLSRVERGMDMDGKTLAKIITWLLKTI